eukprot:TRINITY_DN65661_c0_g1_i1.p1 TRINITY_DN65661_c0_g1~~TRINITY_DN65661_c0_g1_i1.p1  ORF type:complete len:463 (+),score=108.69 TRINITY_DN65661_c0_g1_i1:137-1525(+)
MNSFFATVKSAASLASAAKTPSAAAAKAAPGSKAAGYKGDDAADSVTTCAVGSISSVTSKLASSAKDRASSMSDLAQSNAREALANAKKYGNEQVAKSKEAASAAAADVVNAATDVMTQLTGPELQVRMEEASRADDKSRISELLDSALAAQALDMPGIRTAAQAFARKQLKDAMKLGDKRRLKGALIAAKRLQATGLPDFQAATQMYRDLAKLPAGWDVEAMVKARKQGRLLSRAAVDDPSTLALFQRLLDKTFRDKWTRDRKGAKVPAGYEVIQVLEVQNDALWIDYMVRRDEIRRELCAMPDFKPEAVATANAVDALPGPPLEPEIGEAWLFHGTSPIAVEKITADNFSMSFAGTSAGTLYGRGLYFAENCSKADEYATKDNVDVHSMILCRVTMGNPYVTAAVQPDPRECEELVLTGQFHSIIGDRLKCRGTYREFILFDESQVYANFIVQYKRITKD